MKIRILFIVGAVSGAVGMPFASSAKDDPALPDVNVSALTVDGIIGEATLDAESLKGKVVAVEYWGQH
jgi:hypothetical protein